MTALPLLVLVTGPPASGKTTIARALAAELGLPLACRDDVKELLYDEIGIGDREWSRRLGRASYAVLFHWLTVELGVGRSLIAETNFPTEHTPVLLEALPPHRTFQVHCTATDEVLLERYASRERHPGHVDDEVIDEVRRGEHEGRFDPLPIDGQLVRLDTTDEEADVPALAARIAKALEAA